MGPGIWLIIFVFLLVVGAVMTGIGVHEKTKHKDDKTPPGTTYEVLLYGGIALIVIGLIGAIWAGLKYGKSKSKKQSMNPQFDDMGIEMTTPRGYGMDNYGTQDSYGVDVESQMMAPVAPPPQNRYMTLPNGSVLDTVTGNVIGSSNVAPQQNSTASVPEKKDEFTLDDMVKAATYFEKLKKLMGGM